VPTSSALSIPGSGTYRHPGGGWFGETGVTWLKWQQTAMRPRQYQGADCILCKNPIWEVAGKNMK
jgi:hypothetical protein